MKQARIYANRKLKEFGRWQRIARDGSVVYSDDYILQADGNNFQPVERLEINQETARQELNAIKSAINAISDIRQRQVLILNYLEGKPVEQVRLEIKRTLEPFEPIKKSQYYTLKNSALLAFAKQYRNGVLETLPD
ncbi:ArpU family transcriptional regulator [Streptococcus sp. zg-86]|uniref:ArpU family transcriptional regulator n=1 Tax=Streptococcus zhangguiae TaxID=2664091 RepID=A0A6I4REA8_9STRE|nr:MULTISPECIES: ArpU family transcriptional regulator [unclassified Streptococcus]MTB63852.1 ArpU family transcriptional regulator [Streptococcus sp. zg-86]MTB90162.1 ArpU family transcriptional regulator [Streptococcus sp. zg-36]MWV55834.1 ArpU family transcriptional regulator [Streptococcus sp. zg-70]QTH47884.1 ArpU family transcriptional regulator [Streptococcus sp. zg-86]